MSLPIIFLSAAVILVAFSIIDIKNRLDQIERMIRIMSVELDRNEIIRENILRKIS